MSGSGLDLVIWALAPANAGPGSFVEEVEYQLYNGVCGSDAQGCFRISCENQ